MKRYIVSATFYNDPTPVNKKGVTVETKPMGQLMFFVTAPNKLSTDEVLAEARIQLQQRLLVELDYVL